MPTPRLRGLFVGAWILFALSAGATLVAAQAASPSPGPAPTPEPPTGVLMRVICAFVGAVFADLLGLSAALRAGDMPPQRWKQPRTYLGLLVYGALAATVVALFPQIFTTRLLSFVAGSKLPDVLAQLGQLGTPRNLQASNQAARVVALAGGVPAPGPLPAPIRMGALERLRRVVARQE
jgi:hypothetical protein